MDMPDISVLEEVEAMDMDTDMLDILVLEEVEADVVAKLKVNWRIWARTEGVSDNDRERFSGREARWLWWLQKQRPDKLLDLHMQVEY